MIGTLIVIVVDTIELCASIFHAAFHMYVLS